MSPLPVEFVGQESQKIAFRHQSADYGREFAVGLWCHVLAIFKWATKVISPRGLAPP